MAKRPLRICIATHDIVGPIRNGGIGTAYHALAVALARAGHNVTVLYGLGQHCENRTIAHWQRHYRALGIAFEQLPDYAEIDVRGEWAARASYRAYLWLKDKTFDIVHVHEWRGLGYYTLLAKRQGLSLQDTTICVGAHSPSFWHKEGMRETPTGVEDFEVDFLERESVRLADVVWSPSRHMLQWMEAHGWPAPARSFVTQYIMLDRARPSARQKWRRPVDEFVFFGRLETRKGLDLFCDALDRLAAAGTLPKRVLFLGKVATVDGVDCRTYLKKRARKWCGLEWRIEPGFDRNRALAYLRRGRRLAVLPSRVDNLPLTVLECLGMRIPFISSDVGGIPEMVRKADAPRVLFPLNAEAWSAALGRTLHDGAIIARPAIPFDTTVREWLNWHTQTAQARPRRIARAAQPKPRVTVCLTHRNRPDYLRQSLESIRKQTYGPLEVVLVDDGSDKPEAIAFLDSLEAEFAERRWKIVRQSNRYPGAARNTAARHATGRYLLFMDDDNVATPHEVETLVKAIETGGADLVTCVLEVFQTPTAPQNAGQGTYRWLFLGPCATVGTVRNCFGDTNMLIDRQVFAALGGFTEDFGVGFEDWEFLAKAVLRGYKLQVVPEPLVWYRQTGVGVNSTTAFERNHMRALRPYLEQLSPEHRNLLLLAKGQTMTPPEENARVQERRAPEPQRLDHVRNVVVFGAGEGGKLAMRLADACGWSIPYLVDNNPGLWNQEVHGLQVKPPSVLKRRDFDLIVVASYAGKRPLFKQLDRMGFSYRSNYTFFLDPVKVGSVRHQVTL